MTYLITTEGSLFSLLVDSFEACLIPPPIVVLEGEWFVLKGGKIAMLFKLLYETGCMIDLDLLLKED